MNIGEMENWADYSTPISGVVNDEFNGLENWADYSTPPLIFSEGEVSISQNAIFFGMNF